MLMDKHDLRRGIKVCGLMDIKAIARRTGESTVDLNVVVAPHFFIDLPNSKRRFCCTKHGARDRKRRERAAARRKVRQARTKK
jgi:hypothetical protein